MVILLARLVTGLLGSATTWVLIWQEEVRSKKVTGPVVERPAPTPTPAPPGRELKLRVVGFEFAPLVVGHKVTVKVKLRNEGDATLRVNGGYTVRYVPKVPEDAAERRQMENDLWIDFKSKPLPGEAVALSIPPNIPDIWMEHFSEKEVSPEVLEGINRGGAIYVMGFADSENGKPLAEYCIYGLANPSRTGLCIDHN